MAGGVGITPMRALLESLESRAPLDLVLLYRARRAEDLVFRRELDALATQRGARVVYLLGDNPDLLSTRTCSDSSQVSSRGTSTSVAHPA